MRQNIGFTIIDEGEETEEKNPAQELSDSNEMLEWLKFAVPEYCIKNNLYQIVNNEIYIDFPWNYTKQIIEFPFKIKYVKGDFILNGSMLESFKNFPDTVYGDLIMPNNRNLKSLKGCPSKIYGDFDVQGCGLTSLDHFPEYVDGNVFLKGNNFDSLAPLSGCMITKAIYLESHQNADKYNKLSTTASDYIREKLSLV